MMDAAALRAPGECCSPFALPRLPWLAAATTTSPLEYAAALAPPAEPAPVAPSTCGGLARARPPRTPFKPDPAPGVRRVLLAQRARGGANPGPRLNGQGEGARWVQSPCKPITELTPRVPAKHFEEAAARPSRSAGKVSSRNVQATDVGEAYRDLSLRLHTR